MTRKLTAETAPKIIDALNLVADKTTNTADYSNAMYTLGQGIGDSLLSKIDVDTPISLACTNEDADFLTQGIIDVLEKHGFNISLTCFWNERQSIQGLPDIAPILKRYQEPNALKVSTLIVVKSIIATACVVKTNLTSMIHNGKFDRIIIAAPVIYNRSVKSLENEFPISISKQFEYIYFAEDSEFENGEIIPGIGGNLYNRLGFINQQDKNKHLPMLIKQRRALFI